MYHGTPTEREHLRQTIMRQPEDSEDAKEKPPSPKRRKVPVKKRKAPTNRRRSRRTTKRETETPPESEDGVREPEEDKLADDSDAEPDNNPKRAQHDRDALPTTQSVKTFPVVVTTFEMIIKDRTHLAKYNWGYIVVDEGHRLKNIDCRLMQEIKKYPSAGRMILTGTPLHVSCSIK